MNPLDKAKELGQLLVESDEYKRFKAAESQHLSDSAAQEIMENYNLRRLELAAKMRDCDMDEEQLKEVRAEMVAETNAIMENEVVREYIEAAQDFSELIAQVNAIISHFVKGEDADDCGGGGCGGCHGCG